MNTNKRSNLLNRWFKWESPCVSKMKHKERDRKKVAVMFSGGLDSTYAAWYMKSQGYEVHLFHVNWTYTDSPTVEGDSDTACAVRVAQQLELPLHVLGKVVIPGKIDTGVGMIPPIAAMILCHRTHDFDILATGIEDPRMAGMQVQCAGTVEAIAKECMPWVEVVHPRAFKSAKEIWRELPEELLPLQASPNPGCGGCARRRETIKRWISGLK